MRKLILDDIYDAFDTFSTPAWYPEAVSYMRAEKDRGLFGLYIYDLVKNRNDIEVVVNLGTARGHSAVYAVKGLQEAGRSGEVHMFDIIPPDEQRNWHGSDPDSDPLRGKEISMREIIRRFHDPDDESIPINCYKSDSHL